MFRLPLEEDRAQPNVVEEVYLPLVIESPFCSRGRPAATSHKGHPQFDQGYSEKRFDEADEGLDKKSDAYTVIK